MRISDTWATSGEESAPRLIATEEAQKVIEELKSHSKAESRLSVTLQSWWASSQRWARNEASLTSDQRNVSLIISKGFKGGSGYATSNQINPDSLKAVVEYLDSLIRKTRTGNDGGWDMAIQPPDRNSEGAIVWSEKTFNRTALANGKAVHSLAKKARDEGLLSAGYIESAAAHSYKYSRDRRGMESVLIGNVTQAQCSTTVRNSTGNGSGWAGNTSFDLGRLDLSHISESAFDKCIRSLNPVRIEPGRYQTILEPQAASVFFELLVKEFDRDFPEKSGRGPFFLDNDLAINRRITKLGLQVVDKRITINHDPTDTQVGTHKDPGVNPVTLVNKGILTSLYSNSGTWLNEHANHNAPIVRSSFRVEGTQTTMEEMIETTKRGLIVTRMSHVQQVDQESVLYTGVTRDGLWLIENGKITKAVRNFRWTESPLFVFNNVEEIGKAVPIFNPTFIRNVLKVRFADSLNNIVVPACKINDFSFTSTIDAI